MIVVSKYRRRVFDQTRVVVFDKRTTFSQSQQGFAHYASKSQVFRQKILENKPSSISCAAT